MPRKKIEGQTQLFEHLDIAKDCDMCKGTCKDIGKPLYPNSPRYGHILRTNCCSCRIAMPREEWCEVCEKRDARKKDDNTKNGPRTVRKRRSVEKSRHRRKIVVLDRFGN